MSVSHHLKKQLSLVTPREADRLVDEVDDGFRTDLVNFPIPCPVNSPTLCSWLLIFCISSFTLTACSDSYEISGGTDFPNEISGTVAQGPVPQPQAVVKLYKRHQAEEQEHVYAHGDDFELVQTDTTDPQGNFNFETKSGSYFIEATYNSLLINVSDSIFIPENDTVKIDLAPILLYYGGSLQGRLIAEESELSQVGLAGTPYVSEIDSDGRFRFTDLPPGTYGILSLYGQGGQISSSSLNIAGQVQPDSILDIGTIEMRTQELMFDDFEFDDERVHTGYLYGGGWWYGTGAGEYNADPKAPGYPLSQSIVYEQNNHVFHAKWDFIGSSLDPQYYVFGFNIGFGADGWINENTPHELSFFDFSQVDKISFKAKGVGTIRVQLGSKEIRLRSVSEVAHYGTDVTLKDEYQNYIIDVNDFKLGDVNQEELNLLKGLNWSEVRQDIYALAFVVTSDAEIWLDDIKLIDYSIHQF